MPEDEIVGTRHSDSNPRVQKQDCQLGIKCMESGPLKEKEDAGVASIFTRVVKKGLSQKIPFNREPHSEHVR